MCEHVRLRGSGPIVGIVAEARVVGRAIPSVACWTSVAFPLEERRDDVASVSRATSTSALAIAEFWQRRARFGIARTVFVRREEWRYRLEHGAKLVEELLGHDPLRLAGASRPSWNRGRMRSVLRPHRPVEVRERVECDLVDDGLDGPVWLRMTGRAPRATAPKKGGNFGGMPTETRRPQAAR